MRYVKYQILAASGIAITLTKYKLDSFFARLLDYLKLDSFKETQYAFWF
jgi:hypothetical protein